MQVPEWRNVIGELVRDHMRSPELEHYFSVKMNQASGAAHDFPARALYSAPPGLLVPCIGKLSDHGDQAKNSRA